MIKDNISTHIYYGPHGTAFDAELIREPFSKCDIYIPEMSGWEDIVLRLFNQVSEGTIHPGRVLAQLGWNKKSKPFIDKTLDIIYGSKKPILSLDVPNSDNLYAEARNATNGFLKVRNGWHKYESLASYYEALVIPAAELAASYKKREDFIIDKFEPELQTAIYTNDNLKAKLAQNEKISVLISLGAYHTRIYHELKRQGFLVSRSFPANPFVFNYFNQMIRTHEFLEACSYSTTSSYWLENFCEEAKPYNQYSENSQLMSLFIRTLVSMFSQEEIEAIFEEEKKPSSNPEDKYYFFLNALRTKNIPYPKSDEDMKEFILRRSNPARPKLKI